MKNGIINRSILSLVSVLVCGCGIKTHHETTCADYPNSLGFESDYEHVFDSTQIKSLIARLSGYEATSTNEIAVATVSTIKPDKSIFDYSLQLRFFHKISIIKRILHKRKNTISSCTFVN